jgi:exonuclease SbcC
MLPKRLELHNFLAYRAPDPIILEDLHLACLSGYNGAGKSSLLDAITWALWGKARGRSDDDLVHIGQSEMQVTLDFVQDDRRYRVIRKRKLGKPRKEGGRAAGQSTLDLFGWDEERQGYTLISEPSMRETQTRIDALLRLDYELFVHSAFLQQGKADAFTNQTPARRKDILTEILGLDRWALYEEAAKEHLRKIEQEIEHLTISIADMESEIAEEPGLQRELELAREQLAEAEAQVHQAEAYLNEVRGADSELWRVQESLASVEYNIRERQKDLSTLEAEITRYQERLAHFQEIVRDEAQIKQGYARLEEARAADSELGNKLRDLNEINQRIAKIEEQLNKARQEIDLEIRQLETEVQRDQQVVMAGKNVLAQIAELDQHIAELENLEKQREEWQDQISHLNEEAAALRARNDSLKAEMDEIRQRLDMVEHATEPLCPVCKQPLDEQHRHDLIAEMTADGTSRGNEYRSNTARMKEVAEEIALLKKQIQDASNYLKDLPRYRSQRGSYEQQLTDARAAEDNIRANEIKLLELQTRLAEGGFGEAWRVQLTEAQAERDRLGYDADEHHAIREELETHLGYQDKAKQLDLAAQQIPEIQQSLDNAFQRQARWLKNLEEFRTQAAAYQEEINHLENKVTEMRLREDEVNKQRTLQRNAQEKVIQLEQRLQAIDKQRQRRITMLERREDYKADAILYEQLKGAFGRNGIPAMLIDAAIPELEEASNRLLGRMTNNRMHVMFTTQREKKTGGMAETLDILIADELGTRDYSLFSGGEAFRVNFAIRVALSQLLTRRAGAQLRTLFIDEGFGTQDDVGRERLVEAINAIQNDFDLILVITHIDELKDAFPVRIEVTKTPNGSLAVVR